MPVQVRSTWEEGRYYYPRVNKRCRYRVEHPVFIYEPSTTDLSLYFRLTKVTVLPPKDLFHSVLPHRAADKLTFLLSATCAEENVEKPVMKNCDHPAVQAVYDRNPAVFAGNRKGCRQGVPYPKRT